VQVSYALEFDGPGLRRCTAGGCTAAPWNGSHTEPAFYVFIPAAVANFRRLEIAISGGAEAPGARIAHGHWEVTDAREWQALDLGGQGPRARVLSVEPTRVFTAELWFGKGLAMIAQIGIFTWLLKGWWD
jgi:hypothetical protein